MKEEFLKFGRVHMIGIGGVSMSGIAEHLTHFGVRVTGSDQKESKNTNHLKELGIEVVIGHDKTLIDKADTIVYTAAIPKTDEEYVYAKNLGKTLMERSEFLGLITKCYKECICISGTHGKTTTTSMIAVCFLKANLDPTIEVGAYLKAISGNNRTGNSDYFILEACEYVDSFLKFFPKTEIILNIDNDHLDYFKNIDNIKNSFLEFTEKLPEDGILIGNIDDENTKEVLLKSKKRKITYGIYDTTSDYRASNIQKDENGYPKFDVFKKGKYFETFTLGVYGTHNILNALSCIACCDYYGISKINMQEGLKEFHGANRRFEKIGEYKGIPVIDDYAHHPTEISATYASTLEVPHLTTWAVFEPHTFSRTKNHLEEFADVLSKFNRVVLADIYAAREKDSLGITSKDLEKKILQKNPNCVYLKSYDEIIDYLKENVKEKDIIVTIGAGPINQVGYRLIDSLFLVKSENTGTMNR